MRYPKASPLGNSAGRVAPGLLGQRPGGAFQARPEGVVSEVVEAGGGARVVEEVLGANRISRLPVPRARRGPAPGSGAGGPPGGRVVGDDGRAGAAVRLARPI